MVVAHWLNVDSVTLKSAHILKCHGSIMIKVKTQRKL